MKNLIYAGTSASSSVVPNATVPITSVDKRYNRCNSCSEISLVGNSVAIETGARRPRYNVFAKITFAGATTGDATISVFKDGVAIPFTATTETIGTATTEFHTITIPCSILTNCCSTTSISIVNTGEIGLVVSDASILVIED